MNTLVRVPLAAVLLWLARPLMGEEPAHRPLSLLERVQPSHLAAAQAARLQFARDRRPLVSYGVYEDFRAVIHLRNADEAREASGISELLKAAQQAGVRLVLVAERGRPRPELWRGLREGVLFLAGVQTEDGCLWFPEFGPGGELKPDSGVRLWLGAQGSREPLSGKTAGLVISRWPADPPAAGGQPVSFMDLAQDRDRWAQQRAEARAYPEEFLAAGLAHQPGLLAGWDQESSTRPCTGIAANEARVISLFKHVAPQPEAIAWRALATHVLARELTEAEVLEALRRGHAYAAHDVWCDPSGFAFGAVNNLGVFPMGDAAPFLGTTRLIGMTPLSARLKLYRQGALVAESTGTNLTFEAKESGVYRLEAWLSVDGEDRPWIYSNPVRVRPPALADLQLPSNDLPPEVEARKDLTYVEGPAEEAAKHQLDLYLPKGRSPAPVFFFAHGGAWKYGDRSQYPPLGGRYARAGVVTVIPSYRLAPKFPHPAQIEDVAAAFAWTVRHIAEHGGDTNRLYVGGHSAGGHLAALLALDERYLRRHGLPPRLIRGVMALSGVYDFTVGDSLTSVFGSDAEQRRAASPSWHVKAGAPPFLVSYCEWDYATLPFQARAFHRVLRAAGVPAELLYVPGENHLSEMLHVVQEADPTVAAVLRFMASPP